MKKSNKVSIFYVFSSLALLLVLIGGGVYGIYISVGLSFVNNSMQNVVGLPAGAASNVSIGGTINFEYSMVGIIILSIVLIVLAIFDVVSLIRQIVLFKQFKAINNSAFEKQIEHKVKSKGAVVFFAILIDLLSVAVGVVGIFINSRSFVGTNLAWLFYLIDALIILFAIVSMILLIMKLRSAKKNSNDFENKKNNYVEYKNSDIQNKKDYDIDKIEYKLLKLKHLKNSKIISSEEYKSIRDELLGRIGDDSADVEINN